MRTLGKIMMPMRTTGLLIVLRTFAFWWTKNVSVILYYLWYEIVWKMLQFTFTHISHSYPPILLIFSKPQPNDKVHYCDQVLYVILPSSLTFHILDFWLVETFSTSPLKPLNRIQRNLTGSKIWSPSTKFMFFGRLEKKMAALTSQWLRHFRLFLSNHWIEFNEASKEARSQCPLPSPLPNEMAALAWLAETFRNCRMEFNETWQEARSQHPQPSLCFPGPSENFLVFQAHRKTKHCRSLPSVNKGGTLHSGAR